MIDAFILPVPPPGRECRQAGFHRLPFLTVSAVPFAGGEVLYRAHLWPSPLAAAQADFGRGPGPLARFVGTDADEASFWIGAQLAALEVAAGGEVLV